jgi:hypothetical protein
MDLLILCYTLSVKECEDGVTIARALQPEIKTLVLTEAPFLYFGDGHNEAVGALGKPEALIAAAKRIVQPAVSPEISPIQIPPSCG